MENILSSVQKEDVFSSPGAQEEKRREEGREAQCRDAWDCLLGIYT